MKKNIIILFIIIWIISIFYYENRILISSNNINNKAIRQYNSWSYKLSWELLSWALVNNNNFILGYNLWNSYYKLWEENNNIDEKILHYTSALESYSGSLALKYNQDTQDNYEHVEEKLNELLNPEEQVQEDNTTNENPNEWESENSSDENNSEENGNSWEENQKSDKEWENTEWSENKEWEESWTEWDNWEEGDNWEEKESNNDWWDNWWEWNKSWNNLSKEQLEQIEKYAEDLKKSEFYNQKYFNKKEPEQNQDIDWFFRDSFFDDNFVRWWEKDW